MRIQQTPDNGIKVWLSAADTYAWASRHRAGLPCSKLSNRRVFAEFDENGDLVDLTIDGGRRELRSGKLVVGVDEFNSCLTDHIASRYPDHPALRGDPQPI